jgi:hypothetical protein
MAATTEPEGKHQMSQPISPTRKAQLRAIAQSLYDNGPDFASRGEIDEAVANLRGEPSMQVTYHDRSVTPRQLVDGYVLLPNEDERPFVADCLAHIAGV